jgi:hypothetical protein
MNTHTPPPAEPQDSLYLPTDVSPEELFQAIGRLRKAARDEIDRLIQFLDKTDDYVSRELEDQVDDGPIDDDELEPSLCGVTADVGRGSSCRDDREGDDTPTGRSAEDEASLGSGAIHELSDQTQWANAGLPGDLEDEHDGAEPPEDDEPSLGSFEGHDNQDVAWDGETWDTDYELDSAEAGIGDQDGLDEQVPRPDVGTCVGMRGIE